MNDTTGLLIQLGIQYAGSGGIDRAKADLASLAQAARNASTSAGATIAQAAAQAQAMAGQLYSRAAQSLILSGRTALAAIQTWASNFGTAFRSTLAGVALRISPVLASVGNALNNGLNGMVNLAARGTAGLNAAFAFAARTLPVVMGATSRAVSVSVAALGAGVAATVRGTTAVLGVAGRALSGAGSLLASSITGIGTVLAATARGAASVIAGSARLLAAPFRFVGNNLAAGFRNGGPIYGSIGQSPAVQSGMNTLTDAFGAATRAATILATVGIAALVTQFVLAASSARKLVEEFIGVNERFQGLEITLKSSLSSASLARNIRDEIAKITAVSPLPYEGIADLVRALTVIPQTRVRIADQAIGGNLSDPEGFLKKSVLLVEKMLTFRPDKSVKDAVFSIREALGGEYRSLVRRFDIPLSLISQLSGKATSELKTDSAAAMEGLMRVFDRIISTGAIRERAAQPSVVFQNIKEQISTVGALAVGDRGSYRQIQNTLTDAYDEIQQLTRKKKDSSGKDIDGSSLVEQYAEPISKSLVGLLNAVKSKVVSITESLFDRVGLGEGSLPGMSLVERALVGVKGAVDWLSTALPKAMDKAFNIFSALIPILTKIGMIVLKIVDSLTTLFTKVPLASLGLMFGPTRIGMLAHAGGLGLGGSLALGALAAPGLVRGGLGMLPNYGTPSTGGMFRGPNGMLTTGGWGSMTQGWAGSFTVPPAIAGGPAAVTAGSIARGVLGTAGNLAVGAIILKGGIDLAQWLIEDRKNAKKEKLAEISTDQSQLKAWASQQDDESLRAMLTSMEKARPLRGDASKKEVAANKAARSEGLGDIKDRLASSFEGSRGVIAAYYANDKALTDYFTGTIKNILLLRDAGIREVEKTLEQQAAVKAVVARLEERDSKGLLFKNLDDAFNGKDFESTLGRVSPLLNALISSTEQGGAQYFKEAFDSYIDEITFMGEGFRKMDTLLLERAKTMALGREITSKLLDEKGLLAGQAAALKNFEETLKELESLKANKTPGDTRIPRLGIHQVEKSLDEAIVHFKGLVTEMQSESKDLSEATFNAVQKVRGEALGAGLISTINAVKGLSILTEQLTSNITSGKLVEGSQATAAFADLKAKIEQFDPRLAAYLNPRITALQEALPAAGADEDTLFKVKAQANALSADMDDKLRNYLKQAAEVVDEFYKSMFNIEALKREVGAGMSDGQRYIKRQSFEPNRAGPRISRSTGRSSYGFDFAGAESLVNDDLVLPSTTVEPALASLEEMEKALVAKGLAAREKAEMPPKGKVIATAEQVIARSNKAGRSASRAQGAADRYADNDLDARVTNALQEISSVLSAAQTIEKEGPLAASMREQFRSSVAAFPELAEVANKSMPAIFAAFKEGDTDISVLQAKMVATVDLSNKMVSILEQRAAAERRTGDISMSERFTDSARKIKQEVAGIAQSLSDLEEKMNHPFQSFFKGMAEGVGATKNLILEMGNTGKEVGQMLAKNLGNAFYDLVTGAKKGKEAFADFTEAILKDMARMATEAAAKQLIGVLANIAGSAVGAAGNAYGDSAGLQGSFVGGSYTPNGGAVAGYGYSSSGGYTAYADGGVVTGGKGGIDDVVARLTAGEYVLTKSTVDRVGVRALDELNGYANGGLVGNRPYMPDTEDTSSAGKRDPVVVNIPITINGGDDGETDQDRKEMARQLEAAVVTIVEKHQRPGGSLRR